MSPKILIVLAIFFWSTAFVAIRTALADYSPGSVALFRFGLAAMCFAIPYFRSQTFRPSRKQMALIAVIGPLGIAGYSVLLNQSEIHIAAGIACFVVSLTPVLSSFMAVWFLKERMTPRLVEGLLVSLAGLAIIAASDFRNLEFNLSLSLLMGAVIFGALQSVAQKKLVGSMPSLHIATLSTWVGCLILLVYSGDLASEFGRAGWQSTLSCIYLGLVPSFLAQWFWTHSLRSVPLTFANTFLFAMPLLTTAVGYCVLGESPSMLALNGGIVAIAGAAISVHQPSKPRVSPGSTNFRG